MLKNKTLLITGGTGSFGNAALDRFLQTEIGEIRIFSRDEQKQDDMRIKYNNEKLKFYIGDVRDYDSINSAMAGVDLVFSAAALKQVSSCEFFPVEAVKTNIIGTENTLAAAIANNVKKVVVLSTDKAVYPINAMGMSKGLMEKCAIAKSKTVPDGGTLICCTRFGNVMVSRGSVIPLFCQQIKSGLPLTVTNPEMTRFMMSLDDAVDLVMYTFEHGLQGDIFVQKSPAAKIGLLAETLIKIFKSDNGIKIIGPRHCEKKYETLVTKEDMRKAVDMGDYYRIPADSKGNSCQEPVSGRGKEKVEEKTEYNSDNTYRLNGKELEEMLLKLPFIQDSINNN